MLVVKCLGKALALHENCSHYGDTEEEALSFWGGVSKKRIYGRYGEEVECYKGVEEKGV